MKHMKWEGSPVNRGWGEEFQRHMLKYFKNPFTDLGWAEIGAIEMRIQARLGTPHSQTRTRRRS